MVINAILLFYCDSDAKGTANTFKGIIDNNDFITSEDKSSVNDSEIFLA